MNNVKKFILMTFTLSWLSWAPLVIQTMGIIETDIPLSGLKILGAISPMISGLLITRGTKGKAGLKKLIQSSLLKWVSVKWTLTSIFIFFGVNWVSRAIFSIFETELPKSEVVTNIPSFIIFTILVFFVGGGLGEEIGWRGFLTEELLQSKKPVVVIGIVSAIWTLWHLPLFYIGGTNQAYMSFLQFSIPVVALTVIITWLYTKTRSVLLCAILHTFGNVAHEVFKVIPTESATSTMGFTIFTAMMIVIAGMIIIFDQSLYVVNDSNQYSMKKNGAL